MVYLCYSDSFIATTSFSGSGFTLSQVSVNPIFGNCGQTSDYFIIRDAYFSIYVYDFDIPNNPFIYTLQAIGDYHELTIENGNGDWAVYSSKLLSNPSFNQIGFALYPNPVNETLYINNTFNQKVQATIYEINGKVLYTHTIENNNATINVKTLNQGLYFVVFENEAGERVSNKFIKR